MISSNYRYAVIGFGRRGRALNRAIQNLTDVEAQCVAVADIREPTAEERERFGRSFYSDYSKMLAKEKLDFVIVDTELGAVRRYVRLGESGPDDRIEVISGLAVGETILIASQ